jgi:hypothetical protein
MEDVRVLAALWVGLALLATLLAIWFRISTALTEIVVGTVAQRPFSLTGGEMSRHIWLKLASFCSGLGACPDSRDRYVARREQIKE